MLFNSYIFVFLFLPLCLTGYFLLNHFKRKKAAQIFLLCMSLWFYAYFNVGYLAIIIGSILINYGFYYLSRIVKEERARKVLKALAVLCNLAVLFYYKYFDFFVENVNALFGTEFTLLNILLPLGISFFTFQQISLVIDAFNGEVPDYDFISYACFVAFFPQLVAGPIVSHDELVPQLMSDDNKRFSWDSFSKGFFIFALGLGKKVLLADALGGAVDYGFSAFRDFHWEDMNSTAVYISAISYTLQLYFDFSGYSDMAVGIGKMFNMDLPRNFNSPYQALSATEFWKRWHITLTRFLRKYIYYPLGGNRKGAARTYLNIMIVYFVSGLWHGADWTFVVWGLLNGAFCVVYRLFRRFFERLPKALNWLITFAEAVFAFVAFRAESMHDTLFFWARMLKPRFGSLSSGFLDGFAQPEFMWLFSRIPALGNFIDIRVIIMILYLTVSMLIILVPKNAYAQMERFTPDAKKALLTAALLCWCICSFSGVSTFLYFNF